MASWNPFGGGDDPSPTPPVPEHRVYRGKLILGNHLRSFTPCRSDLAYWTMDTSSSPLDQIYEELSGGSGEAIYVEFRGVMGDPPADRKAQGYHGRVEVEELIRASYLAADGRCPELRPGVDFRASGNEPFWSVDVGMRSIVFRQPDHPKMEVFPPALPKIEGKKIVFHTTSLEDARRHLTLTLAPGPCRDTMSGEYASWSATLELGGRTMRGCAVQGWGR